MFKKFFGVWTLVRTHARVEYKKAGKICVGYADIYQKETWRGTLRFKMVVK